MSNYPSDHKNDQSRQYLDRIDDIYVFDKASGIYKPRCREPESEEEQGSQNKQKVNLMHVEVRRDWLALIISIITLGVLFGYTLVTYNLWQEAQVSGNHVQQELAIAQLQAVTASKELPQIEKQTRSGQQQISISQKQFQLDQRPYLSVGSFVMVDFATNRISEPVRGKPLVVDLTIKNVGKSAAVGEITHRHLIFGEANLGQVKIEPVDVRKTGDAIARDGVINTTATSIKDTFANETADLKPSEIVNWDGTLPIIVFDRLTYKDEFGNRYCTPYIVRYLNSGSWEHIGIPRKIENSSSNSGTYRWIDDRPITELCPPGTGKPF